MTMWERFTSRLRDAMDAPPGSSSGPRTPSYSLAEKLGLTKISDDALGTELERRRRARGRTPNRRPCADDELDAMIQSRRGRLRDRPVAKAYAALEISPGAQRTEIERAYRTLLRQFHPDRHIGDEEQHKSALALAASLTDSYLLLLQKVERRY